MIDLNKEFFILTVDKIEYTEDIPPNPHYKEKYTFPPMKKVSLVLKKAVKRCLDKSDINNTELVIDIGDDIYSIVCENKELSIYDNTPIMKEIKDLNAYLDPFIFKSVPNYILRKEDRYYCLSLDGHTKSYNICELPYNVYKDFMSKGK